MNLHTYEIKGYELDRKTVSAHDKCGAVYLPKSWVGRQVDVILLEEPTPKMKMVNSKGEIEEI